MNNILKLPTELIQMIALNLEWDDLLKFTEAMHISGVDHGADGLLTSPGFYFSYFRERYPRKILNKIYEYEKDIVGIDNVLRYAYRNKEEFCAYFCNDTKNATMHKENDLTADIMRWANETATLFHDLYLCWIDGSDDTKLIECIDEKLLEADQYYDSSARSYRPGNVFFNGFFSGIFYELVLIKIQGAAAQHKTFEDFLPDFQGCNILTGFRSCFNKFFYAFAEKLICHPYKTRSPSSMAKKEEFPGWSLIQSVLPYIDDYGEFCRDQRAAAFKMILDCEYKLKEADYLLHYVVIGKLKGWEEFLATILAENLNAILTSVIFSISPSKVEATFEYLKKWRPLVSDDLLRKKLPDEITIVLSLRSEEFRSFLFGENLELNENFFKVVANRYIDRYKYHKYPYIEKLLTKNNTTVEPMREFLEYFARKEKRINSCFALDWAVRYNLTETLSERDALNDFFESKLSFKGKHAQAIKEYLATLAESQGFEYLPRSLLKPGYKPRNDKMICADLNRCSSERKNLYGHLRRRIRTFKRS